MKKCVLLFLLAAPAAAQPLVNGSGQRLSVRDGKIAPMGS